MKKLRHLNLFRITIGKSIVVTFIDVNKKK